MLHTEDLPRLTGQKPRLTHPGRSWDWVAAEQKLPELPNFTFPLQLHRSHSTSTFNLHFLRMERGKWVLEPVNGSEENWLQEVSLSPSADCLNPPVEQQYGERLEMSPFLPRAAELCMNCCLWRAFRAWDRRRQGNAKHYILNSCAWACAQLRAHSETAAPGLLRSHNCSQGWRGNHARHRALRESHAAVSEGENIWLPSPSSAGSFEFRVEKLLSSEPKYSFGKSSEGSLLGVPQGIRHRTCPPSICAPQIFKGSAQISLHNRNPLQG